MSVHLQSATRKCKRGETDQTVCYLYSILRCSDAEDVKNTHQLRLVKYYTSQNCCNKQCTIAAESHTNHTLRHTQTHQPVNAVNRHWTTVSQSATSCDATSSSLMIHGDNIWPLLSSGWIHAANASVVSWNNSEITAHQTKSHKNATPTGL